MTNEPHNGAPRVETSPAPAQTLPILITQLGETLEPSDEPEELRLKRQIATLDHVFNILMHDKVLTNLNCRHEHLPQGWLDYALRLQKQCADTHKALTASAYMNALTPPPREK